MRPLVSSSVLYVDLLFSTSTTTTTPSSAGISSETRTSCDRPTACVTEAILSTTTERIAICLFPFCLFAGTPVEHTGERDDLRETQGVGGRPLARRFAVHALRGGHQRIR